VGDVAALDRRAAAGERGRTQGDESVVTLLPHESLPDGAIDRIVAAAGHAPDDLNRDQLRADLEGIVSLYRASVDLRYKPAKRSQGVLRIVETAKHLQSLIDGNWRLRRHRGALNRLIADAEFEFPKLMTVLGVQQVSAFENLVGLMLRSTFELHFKVAAGYTNDDFGEEVRGAFIDFTEAALTELGITYFGAPYSRRSIAAALSKVRKQ
jgi:hypothetical protein